MTVYAQRFWPNLPFRQANQMLMADQIERFWLITKLSRSRWWMRTDRPNRVGLSNPCATNRRICRVLRRRKSETSLMVINGEGLGRKVETISITSQQGRLRSEVG
jgi:hypothetical protein